MWTRYVSIAITALAALALVACGGSEPAAQPSPAPSGPDAAKLGTIERDVTYCSPGGVDLKLDVYYPKAASGALPVAMYVHGGGWTQGDKRSGAGAVDFQELTGRGYLAVAIDYRLAPKYLWPAMIEDTKCAVRYLRAHAAEYGLDPNRIGAFGGSAGGHLVALLGTTGADGVFEGDGGWPEQSSAVQAVVDFFGPSSLGGFMGTAQQSQIIRTAFGEATRETLEKASPVTWVDAGDPPFLILHGDKDALVPLRQSELLYEALTKAGVQAELVVVKNAAHGFVPSGGPIEPSRAELSRMIGDFFDRHLK